MFNLTQPEYFIQLSLSNELSLCMNYSFCCLFKVFIRWPCGKRYFPFVLCLQCIITIIIMRRLLARGYVICDIHLWNNIYIYIHSSLISEGSCIHPSGSNWNYFRLPSSQQVVKWSSPSDVSHVERWCSWPLDDILASILSVRKPRKLIFFHLPNYT
jgi:hypothetical protein